MSETQKSLSEVGPVSHVAEVVYHGDKLLLPVGMSIEAAMDLLKRRQQYLQEKVVLSDTFDVFPWDGAHALDCVLTKLFGWSPATATPGFFGPNPPKLINIEVGYNKRKQVPWGGFSLPGVDGLLTTDTSERNGHVVFSLNATVLRKDEETIKRIFDLLHEETKTNSIYRGQAIKVRFRDDDGDKLDMPEPSFMDTTKVSHEMLVYSDAVSAAIETNLFTPITRISDCLANDISVKRGVLLGGPYGTGKTLAAAVAAQLAVKSGLTFVYVPRADELKDAIEFAMLYQSPASVVFCEDIDRAVKGERSIKVDDILNIIDGIDGKNANIITVLTTNHMENINPAMMRPGRLDAVIEVTPPDAKAAERLLRVYGGAAISPDTDLTEAAEKLAGQIPAIIAEVAKRAKLSQLRRQPPGEPVSQLSADALTEASETMTMQLALLAPKEPKEVIGIEPIISDIVRNVLHEVMDRD